MKSERKRLIEKLDKLCRQILLIRDARHDHHFQCVSCRRLLPLDTAQVGHFIPRKHFAVRWDLRNINLQCPHCNKWLSGNLVEYRKALIEMHGVEEVVKMETFYREPPRYTVFDLQEIVKQYQGILLKYQQSAFA